MKEAARHPLRDAHSDRTKAQQAQARREVLRISRQMSARREDETWSHLLRTSDGTIDQPRIDQLMGERDNRPLSIPE